MTALVSTFNDEILDRWNCESCTYSNHVNSSKCYMCSSPKPNQIQSNNSNVIKCIYCELHISLNQYEDHLLCHEQQSSIKNETIPCEFCEQLISISSYTNHLDKHKQERQQQSNDSNATIPCDKCGQQIPAIQYNNHITSHNKPPRIICDICNQSVIATEIESHKLAHQYQASEQKKLSNPENDLIPCEYDSCNDKISPKEYESHISAHKLQKQEENKKEMKDEMDYIPCDICKYKIPSNEYEKHRTSHDNINVLIPCDYPLCIAKIPFDQFKHHKEMHRKEEEKKTEEMCVICDEKGCGKSIPIKQFEFHQESHRMEETNIDLHQQLAKLQQQIEDVTSQKEIDKKQAAQEAQQLKLKIAEQEANAQNNQVIYPKWWDMNELKALKYGEYKLIELDINTNDVVKEVVASFKKTAGNEVVKVFGVMNQMLYDKWWNEKQTMIKLIGNDQLNKRDLFHGTKREDTMNFILKEGFRKEFNTSYASGQGTYLARDASYSVGYSSNVNGLKKMFCCKVVCGESHAGSSAYTLTTWPKKSNGLIYDSLVAGSIDNPSVVVIHGNSRIYPMFVIHFR